MGAAISASVIAAGLGGGIWAGYQAGRDGRKLAFAMVRGAGRSGLLIIACTSIIALSVSLHELRSARERYLVHTPGSFYCGCFGCMESELTSSPTPMTRAHLQAQLRDPIGVLLSATAPGAIWAFLAPAFALLGAVPAAIGGGVAHTFGLRARETARVLEQMADYAKSREQPAPPSRHAEISPSP